MNDTGEHQGVPTALSRAMVLAIEIEQFPLGKCGPCEDLEGQWGYIYAFLDVVRPFVAAIKRIGDPDLSEQVSGFNLDMNYITEAYELKADLQGVIDHLREVAADPTYGASVEANAAFLEPGVLSALRGAKSEKFDFAKLIRLCEELNDAYGRSNYLSCALLTRAVMNHVPPVFGCQTFAQVTAQSGKSLKAVFERLEDSARPIADLHTQRAHSRERVCTHEAPGGALQGGLQAAHSGSDSPRVILLRRINTRISCRLRLMCMAVTRRGRKRGQECASLRTAISLAAHLLTALPAPAPPSGPAHESSLTSIFDESAALMLAT